MIHIDGFDQFEGEQALVTALARADYTPVGSVTVVAGRALVSKAIACQVGSFTRTHPWTTSKFSVGTAFRFTDRGSVLSLKMGGESLIFWLHPDTGLPMLNAVVGGALPVKNVWYYFEIECDKATGKAVLSINNRVDSEFNLTPAMLAAVSVDVLLGHRPPSDYRPGATYGDNGVKTYDDFYILEGAKLGPVIITTRAPTADVNVEWFKAGVAPTHSATLSLTPPTPLDAYVASDTIGKEERFTSNKPLVNANAIVATGLIALARKSPTLSAKLGVFMGGTSGAPLRQDTRTVSSNWRTQYVCFEQIAGDTKANIEATQFGLTVTP